MGQENCKPQPGDLIEIHRSFHQHWALYLGDGKVINLTPAGKRYMQLGVHTVPEFIRKVKKQRLKAVVRNRKWRINNKYDHTYSPLPVEEIIQRAVGYIGKVMTYRVFGSNCEHFVTMLRYGEGVSRQPRASVGSELPIPNMTEDSNYPNPGDLIEIKRSGYQHWALYVGDGYVIHVTLLDEEAPSLSASSVTVLTGKAKVKMELLMKVVGNDTWRVNNKYDWDHVPLSVGEIIQRAEQWIGRVVPYGLFGSNCEHFVTMLRYGEGVSDQAKRVLQNLRVISRSANTGIMTVNLAFWGSIPIRVLSSGLVAGAPFLSIGGILSTLALLSWDIYLSSLYSKLLKRYMLERRCC